MQELRRNMPLCNSTSFISRSPRRSPYRGKENESASFFNVTPTAKRVSTSETKKSHQNALKIYLRVRPLKENEKESCLDVDGNSIILNPVVARGQTKVFDFKKVFDQESTQEEVFDGSFRELLPSLAEGRDLLFFAYGVTGAGKTFTIEGTPEDPGLLSRALHSILESMNGDGPVNLTRFSSLTVSCFEIFNEKVYDLLVPPVTSSKNKKTKIEPKVTLNLGRTTDGRTIVEGANEWNIDSEDQIQALIQKANTERHKAETTFNHNSSRSHVIFRLTLMKPNGQCVYASIVDLAGCERTNKIGDDRIRESCNINKSMLVLGRCIRNLATKQAAVPYRESLITRLFKDFFESPGKCAVAAVIVNVTPAIEQFDDTNFSLGFATDASECYTTASSDKEFFDSDSESMTTLSTAGSMKFDVMMEVQKYLDGVERCYRSQVSQLMERTRCANRLHQSISDTVPRSEYESLLKENENLRAQLDSALKTIKELSM